MTISRILALLALATLVGACGGERQSASSEGHNRPEPAKYTQEQVYSALGVTAQGAGQGISADDGECVASVVMLTPDAIKTYADAGDPVATNPSGTVGVKVGTYQGVDPAMCFDRFTGMLEKLD